MDGAVTAPKDEPAGLPVLRDDLEIVPGAPLRSGAPAWVIFDPVANRYFEIGRELLDMLILWRLGTVGKLVRAIRSEFGRIVTEDDVAEATHFLISNALVRDIPNNDFAMMAAKEAEAKKSWGSTLMHSYLFFRIPLFRPDRFLQKSWPLVAPLFSRWAALIYVLFGVAGLYLVSRQWEQFTGTFQYMLSWEGAAIYGASLVVVKSLHELGHAYQAVRYGLRVPTIGVAFMVLMPVLYTDTSGAWRLKSRKQRLMIDAGGIFTELSLACLATFIWVFLPDGGLRLCFFAVATTSWVSSLLVNLNPLMRFDGYYIMSDAMGFQNLQNRGFDLARWRLREILFGLNDPAPELLGRKTRRIVIAHAWATWIYRFFLFLGIAILVYAFFIKIVGIILFVVEIVWFIALPVWREIKHWWSIRGDIMKAKRIFITGTVLAGLAALSIIPWSASITVPAVLKAEQDQQLFAPFPARVETVALQAGLDVKAGQMLLRLSSPELDRKRDQARERRKLLINRIDRSGADTSDRASLIVLKNELREVQEELEGLDRVRDKLTIRAPFTGVVRDIDPELHAGIWVNTDTPLASILSASGMRIRGYLSEKYVFRVDEGAKAVFIPENLELSKLDATVRTISPASVEELDEPALALKFGGAIATEEEEGKTMRPMTAQYAVSFVPHTDEAYTYRQTMRGVAIVQGEAESFYERMKRQVLKVFVREMGV